MRFAAILILSSFLAFGAAGLVAAQDAGPAPAPVAVDAGPSMEPAPVRAPGENPAEADPAGVAKDLYTALKDRHWVVAFGLAAMLLILVLRKYVFGRVDWFQTKLGGWVLMFSTALVVEMSVAAAANKPLSLDLLLATLGLAWTASGGWSDAKDILAWLRNRKGA